MEVERSVFEDAFTDRCKETQHTFTDGLECLRG